MMITVMDALIFILAICTFVFVAFCVTVCTRGNFKRLKGMQLKGEDIQAINEGGIVHFTTEEFATKIIEENNIKCSSILNRYSIGLKPCVYFFVYDYNTNGAIKYNTSDTKTCGIHVEKLTQEQIKNLRVRLDDGAIIYCGRGFSLITENKVSTVKREDMLKQNGEMPSKHKNNYALACAIFAAIVGIICGAIVSFAVCKLLLHVKAMLPL